MALGVVSDESGRLGVAKPRTSRSASAAPRSPDTVEKRQNHSDLLPSSLNSLALMQRQDGVSSCFETPL